MSNASGGPRTEIGKSISSQNARTHGVCSNVLILPNESKEDFDRLSEMYFHHYSPTSQLEAEFVLQVVEADWRLRRANHHYDSISIALYDEQPDVCLWTDLQHKQLARFQRYCTAGQNSLARFKRMLDSLRKERAAEQRFQQTQADRARRISLAEFKAAENVKYRQNRLTLATERQQALNQRREKASRAATSAGQPN